MARVPIELLLGTPSKTAYETEDTYVTDASEHMWQAYTTVRENCKLALKGPSIDMAF